MQKRLNATFLLWYASSKFAGPGTCVLESCFSEVGFPVEHYNTYSMQQNWR